MFAWVDGMRNLVQECLDGLKTAAGMKKETKKAPVKKAKKKVAKKAAKKKTTKKAKKKTTRKKKGQ